MLTIKAAVYDQLANPLSMASTAQYRNVSQASASQIMVLLHGLPVLHVAFVHWEQLECPGLHVAFLHWELYRIYALVFTWLFKLHWEQLKYPMRQ